MKKIIIALFICTISFAQDPYKKVSKATCECVTKKNLDLKNASKSDIETQFGLCMIQAYSENSKYFPKKDKVDFNNDDQMEKFGAKIALEMLNDCPDIMLAMVKKEEATSEAEDATVAEEDISVSGTFTSTKTDGFLFVVMKEEKGKIHEMVLINNFDNAFLVIDKVLKPNNKIEVKYYDGELFDVKTNKFINVKIISDIIKL